MAGSCEDATCQEGLLAWREDNDLPRPEVSRGLLEKNQVLLIEGIKSGHFRVLLFKNILSRDDWEEIHNKYSITSEKNYFLLDTIKRKGQRGIDAFFEVLGFEYPVLYHKITGHKAPIRSDAYKRDFRKSYRDSGEIFIQKLISTLATEQGQKKNLQDTLQEYAHDHQELVTELSDAKEESAQLRNQNETLQRLCDKYKSEKQEKEEEVSSLRSELQQRKAHFDQLQEDYYSLESEKLKATEQCKVERNKSLRAPTSHQLQKLQEENLKLKIQLDEGNAVPNNDSLLQEMIEVRKELASTKTLKDKAEVRCYMLETKLESSQEREAALKKEASECREKAQELMKGKAELEDKDKQTRVKLSLETEAGIQLDMRCRQLRQDLLDMQKVIENYRECVKNRYKINDPEVFKSCVAIPERNSVQIFSSDDEDSDSDSDGYEKLDEWTLACNKSSANCIKRKLTDQSSSDRSSGSSSDEPIGKPRPSPLCDLRKSELFPASLCRMNLKLVFLDTPASHHDRLHQELFKQSDFKCINLEKQMSQSNRSLIYETEEHGESSCLSESCLEIQLLEYHGYIVLSSKLPMQCLDRLAQRNYITLLLKIEDKIECNGTLQADSEAVIKDPFVKTSTLTAHLESDSLAHIVQDVRVELQHMKDSFNPIQPPTIIQPD